jgi:D-amino peptidase
MKIYLMTDMEGVSGVVNYRDWCVPGGRYYEDGKMLLTLEVNAAVEGFFEAGAAEVHVVDGHGHGGINPILLDRRACYIRHFKRPNPYPLFLDSAYDAIAWVGQHAKAGTEYAHLPHTGNFRVIDYTINGVSIGEFGQVAICGATMGVRSIFGAGDEAFTKEAKSLIPGLETVAVKKGLQDGTGDECDTEAYRDRNLSALHLHPEAARERIREGARRALARLIADPDSFGLFTLQPPYRKVVKYRADGDNGPLTVCAEHPNDVIELMNMPGLPLQSAT